MSITDIDTDAIILVYGILVGIIISAFVLLVNRLVEDIEDEY